MGNRLALNWVFLASAATLAFTGCLRESPVDGNSASENIDVTIDENISLLTAMGFSEEQISSAVDIQGDSAYMVSEAPGRGNSEGRGNSGERGNWANAGRGNPANRENSDRVDVKNQTIAFSQGDTTYNIMSIKKSEVARLVHEAKERDNSPHPAIAALQGTPVADVARQAVEAALGKSAHTRANMHSTLFDVKDLRQVHRVRVFLHTEGYYELGPGWQAAIREAFDKWNEIKGSAVSFEEVSTTGESDLVIYGIFMLGPEGTSTSMHGLTASQYVNGSNYVLFNTGYEGSMSHGIKTNAAMNGLGRILQIMRPGEQGTSPPGFPWTNDLIPGTPLTDANSVFNGAVHHGSVPFFTSGDVATILQMHPEEAMLATVGSNNQLMAVGKHGYTYLYGGVTAFQQESDTIIYLTNTGYLLRKTAITYPLWPASGSSGTPAEFHWSGEYVAVLTTTGRVYTRPIGSFISSWTYHEKNVSIVRLDGKHLYVKRSDGNLYTRQLNPSTSWSTVWYGSNVTDFKVRNGLIAVVDNNSLHVKQGTGSWHYYLAHHNDGEVQRVVLSETGYIGIVRGDTPHSYHAGIRDGISGQWEFPTTMRYLQDPMNVDLCGDNMAALYHGLYAVVYEGATGVVHMPFVELGGDYVSTSIRLSGPLCNYLSTISSDGSLKAKYSIRTDTGFLTYHGGSTVKKLEQRH